MVLAQAAIWLILPLLFYRSPPDDLATALAFGREYRVGTDLGPPLAFWLADIAFRAAGNHMFGVYLLAQLCAIATFWTLFLLARAIVGGQQAVLAVLLTLTVTAFGSPGVEFGPLVLARPLWALLLLHSWQLIGQNRRNAWFAWSIEAGLLLLTTSAAARPAAADRGLCARHQARTAHADVVRSAVRAAGDRRAGAALADLADPRRHAGVAAMARCRGAHAAGRCTGRRCSAGCCWRFPASCCWRLLNSGWFARNPEEAPIIFRPPVDPLARDFVYFFAIAPALAGSLIAGLFNLDRVVGGAGVALLMSGLAAIVATGDLIQLRRQRMLRSVWALIVIAPALATIAVTLFLPWTGSAEVSTSMPGRAIAHFFGDSFERRTNQRLRSVTGDPQLATLISLDSADARICCSTRRRSGRRG